MADTMTHDPDSNSTMPPTAEETTILGDVGGWNFDISQAPRGQTITKVVTTKDGERTYEHFEPDWIWAACKDGKVIKSQWLPEGGRNRPEGRWLFLGSTEQPIAWQPYVIPAHPGLPTEAPEMEAAE